MFKNIILTISVIGLFFLAYQPVSGDTDWNIYKFINDNQEFKILYDTNNVTVTDFTVLPESYSMVIDLTEINEDAKLDITIPRELVAGMSLSDELFVILDGEEIESFEEVSSKCFRTLSIHLPPIYSDEKSELEIIGFEPSMMPTYEQIPKISITTEWNEHADEVIISGCTSLMLNDEIVTVRISDQYGTVYDELLVTPKPDGSFMVVHPTKQLANGTYTVSAEYDDQHTNSRLVIPEFPAIWIVVFGISITFLFAFRYSNALRKLEVSQYKLAKI